MLDTSLTVAQIEEALILRNGGIRKNLCVPNVSWGLLDYEADLIIMNRTGYATEYEIKRSYSDFVADFKKNDAAHNAPCIYKFYFVVPMSIIDKVMALLNEKYLHRTQEMPAIIAYDDNLQFKLHGGSPYRKDGRKMFLEEQLKLARLGTLRYWNLRQRMSRNEN